MHPRRGEKVYCTEMFQSMSSYLIGVAKWVIFYNMPERQNETPSRIFQDGAPTGCKLPPSRPGQVYSVLTTPVATINYIDGQWIEEELAAGNTVSFEFPESNATDLTAAFANSWSSWGTTLDARLKPEISAPGRSLSNGR